MLKSQIKGNASKNKRIKEKKNSQHPHNKKINKHKNKFGMFPKKKKKELWKEIS